MSKIFQYQVFYRALHFFLSFNCKLFEIFSDAESFVWKNRRGGETRIRCPNENQFWNGKRIDLIVRNVRG